MNQYSSHLGKLQREFKAIKGKDSETVLCFISEKGSELLDVKGENWTELNEKEIAALTRDIRVAMAE